MSQREDKEKMMFDVFQIICEEFGGPKDGYCERVVDYILARERKMLEEIEKAVQEIHGWICEDDTDALRLLDEALAIIQAKKG